MNDKNIEEKCCAGCKRYTGGEARHLPECVFYPESLSRIYDEKDNTLTQYKEALRELIKECEEWVVPGAERSNNCENNHYVEIDDLKSLIDKAKQLLNNREY